MPPVKINGSKEIGLFLLLFGFSVGCNNQSTFPTFNSINFPPNNPSITLPVGFNTVVVVNNSGSAHYITVGEDEGDGKKVAKKGNYLDSFGVFPGRWVPNDLSFYDADFLPEKYRNDTLIAFHCSWNGVPLPQENNYITFVSYKGASSWDYEIFADNNTGTQTLGLPGNAENSLMDPAAWQDGSLYITDSIRDNKL